MKIISYHVHDGKVDIVWVLQGIEQNQLDIHDLITEEDDEQDRVEWIQCTQCLTWQHQHCLKLVNPDYATYRCPLLCGDWRISNNIESEMDRNEKVIAMIMELYNYKRDEQQMYNHRKNTKQSYKRRGMDNLLKLAYKLGIDINDNIQKDDLIETLLNAKSFTQTHPDLSRRMAEFAHHETIYNRNDKIRIAEFGAGNGNITGCFRDEFPNAIIDAYESNKGRCNAARKLYGDKDINFICLDLLHIDFLELIDEQKIEKYDLIYFNPPFENTFEFISVAFLLLKEDGYIVSLLPDDVFDGTGARKRLSNILPIKIMSREMVGRWNYYLSFDRHLNIQQNAKKMTSDSLFLIKRLASNANVNRKWNIN